MDYVLVSFLSVAIYHFFLVYQYRKKQKLARDIDKMLSDMAKEMRRDVDVERVDGQWLAYDAKTNAFLTKFADLGDLSKKLESIDKGTIWMFTPKSYEYYCNAIDNDRRGLKNVG